MEKESFEKEIVHGKIIYKHKLNGEFRKKLLNECLTGKISQEKMRKEAKKLKYLFSEKQFLKAIS